MGIPGSKGVIKYSETFATDNISTASADGIAWIYSTDGGTAWSRAVAVGKGLHATCVTQAAAGEMEEFASDQIMFFPQEGYCMVECLLMVSSATIGINFGFNDDQLEDSNLLATSLSTETWTSNATEFVGLVYDSDATNDDWHCFWVDDGTDTSTAIADLRMKGATVAANKWMYLRVELQDRGSGYSPRATFLVSSNGKTFEKTFDTSIDREAGFCFYLSIISRAAVATTAYLKCPGWEQAIAEV